MKNDEQKTTHALARSRSNVRLEVGMANDWTVRKGWKPIYRVPEQLQILEMIPHQGNLLVIGRLRCIQFHQGGSCASCAADYQIGIAHLVWIFAMMRCQTKLGRARVFLRIRVRALLQYCRLLGRGH